MRKKDYIVQLLYFSDLLPIKYPEESAGLFAALEKHNFAYAFIKGAKDIRIRDFMPIQVHGRYPKDNVVFRYEPSYLEKRRDLLTDFSQDIDTNWQLVNGWRPPCDYDKSEVKIDGGNILISPDDEKAIISDRIFSENPKYGKAELVRELDSTLNRPEIIIIPSLESDTTGHADNMVRFLDDQTVLCNEVLESDVFNRQLKTTLQYRGLDVLEFPFAPTEDRSGVGRYLNYLETDEAVFLPVFGIDTDARAVAAAEKMFSKPVEPVKIPNIAADGGGLHSISWDMSYYVWGD